MTIVLSQKGQLVFSKASYQYLENLVVIRAGGTQVQGWGNRPAPHGGTAGPGQLKAFLIRESKNPFRQAWLGNYPIPLGCYHGNKYVQHHDVAGHKMSFYLAYIKVCKCKNVRVASASSSYQTEPAESAK